MFIGHSCIFFGEHVVNVYSEYVEPYFWFLISCVIFLLKMGYLKKKERKKTGYLNSEVWQF